MRDALPDPAPESVVPETLLEPERQAFTLYAQENSQPRLKLVPFERFMFMTDTPEAPCTFRVLMDFDGEVDRALFSQAFQIAISRQPLLTSRIVESGHALYWEKVQSLPEIHWGEEHAGDGELGNMIQEPFSWINIREQAGIRVEVKTAPGNVAVKIDTHHAACDGQGARQLIGEWLIVYAQLHAGEEVKLSVLHPERLESRGTFREADPPIRGFEALRNFFYTVRGRTTHLPQKAKSIEANQHYAEYLSERILGIEETATLRAQLKSRGTSVNDAGLVATYEAFVETFPEAVHPRHYITVLHPVDLRTLSDLRSPACNRVGVCFLRRRPKDLKHRQTFVQSIQDQMSYIKKRLVGAEFLKGLAWTNQATSLNQRLQSWGFFVPTIQFTCLGDATRSLAYHFPMENGQLQFAKLRMVSVSGAMHLGPFLPLSLTLCETGQRLSIVARGSEKMLTKAQLDRYLDCFVARLMSDF